MEKLEKIIAIYLTIKSIKNRFRVIVKDLALKNYFIAEMDKFIHGYELVY